MKTKNQQLPQPIIQLNDVCKIYPSPQGGIKALKGISTDFYPAEFVGILGKSGAGKTTLINMITATDNISSGEVFVNHISIHKLNEDEAARWRGTTCGIVYQSFRLMPTLSLVDNVRLPIDLSGNYTPKGSYNKALEMLRKMGLEEHAHKKPAEISGGQQQRVAIARALANDAPIIVADEPTGRLDSVTAALVMEIFTQLAKQGKCVIMATHDNSAAYLFDRTIRLHDGEIVEEA